MSDEKFKLPQSSYEELSKVIKAYGHFSEPRSLDDISKLIGLHTTIISGNAGFLVGVGILEPGSKKVPTNNGKNLAHALEHNIPNEISTWWQQILSGNDFLTRLLAAIKIRSGMDQLTLESHIVYSAGQPKKPQFMTGARTVIDILKAADFIIENDGKFLLKTMSEGLEVRTDFPTRSHTPPKQQTTPTPHPNGHTISCSEESQRIVQINIQININCTPDDVLGLGDKVKAMINEIASREAINGEE